MPFSPENLHAYLDQHRVSAVAADYIRNAAAGLARDVGTSGYTCLVVEYQSRKMGVTVNTESRTGEFAYALHLDFDDTVVAFYEQPPVVDCFRATKRGNRRLTNYTPDFAVLTRTGPLIVQIKPQKILEELLQRSPDWKLEDNVYRDIAADSAFEPIGIRHEVVSTATLNKLRTSNISLLLQSLDYVDIGDHELSRSCRGYLDRQGISSLKELARAHDLTDYTPIFRLLATHQIFSDLSKFSLVQPDACFVASNPALLSDQVLGAWHSLARDPCASLTGKASRDVLPPAKHLKSGVEIMERLAAGATGRSARRWRNKIQTGEAEGLNPIVAVTYKYHLCGNRQPKRPESVLAFAEHTIRKEWTSDNRPSLSALERIYRTAAEEWHPDYAPLSKPSFRKIRDSVMAELAEARGGRRAANAAQAPTDVEDRALKATRPFELASCDHYLADLYCIVLEANGVQYAMQPWVTVLRDCYTKSVLAFWLTLRAPSRRNCALIMRQCLRTHGRLPETIVVDRGAEFRSVYFSALMAHCRVNLMFRPSGHPRYGSEAERLFGQFKNLWLGHRPGNKVSVREIRSVSGSHRPEKHACLTLLDFWVDLLEFNAWFDHYVTDSSTASPSVLMADGLKRFSCSGVVMPYDDNFVIATAVDDDTYVLDPQHGLHIGAHHFWNPALSRFQGRGNRLSVRRDPEDPYRVYALIGNTWERCQASPAPIYATLSAVGQAAEGVVMLDGSQARVAAKRDAERNLIHALRHREASATALSPVLSLCAPAPVSGKQNDFFSEVADRELAPVETSRW
jgi:putative transposase